MKKDKEWLKEEINKVTSRVYGADFNTVKETDDLIDQLEEPEETKLSEPSAWKIIAKIYHPEEVYWVDIRKQYLESLDKQKNPVIPQFVADWIEKNRDKTTLLDTKAIMIQRCINDDLRVLDWVDDNDDLFTRAWIDGYTVEKEKLYRVRFPFTGTNENTLIQYIKTGNAWADVPVNNKIEKEYIDKFTEKEIKAIDERYWAFAEEVTE